MKIVKVIYDDGSEKDFNEADFISREELDENYLSKEDVEENYVTKEKYDHKKKQAKANFKNQDLDRKALLDEERESLKNDLKSELSFSTKHGFDKIPKEIKEAKERHPTLSRDEAYNVSWYEKQSNTNPNPWREKIIDSNKKEYTLSELASLPQAQYDIVADKIDKGEVKKIVDPIEN